MPQIPLKEKLGQPASFRSGRQIITAGMVDTGAIGQGGKALATGIRNLGSGVGAFFEKREKEREAIELAKADSAFKSGLIKLENNIEDDPEYDSRLLKFETGASTILDKSSSIISNEGLREKWQARAQVEAATRATRVNRNARKLQREQNAVELEGSLKRYQSIYTSPKADRGDRQAALNDIEETIQIGRRSGVLSPRDEQRIREKYVLGTLEEEAEQRLMTDPSGLLKDLQPSTDKEIQAGEDRDGLFVTPDLKVIDRISETAQYGVTATKKKQPFKGIVLHHTRGGIPADNFIKYGHSVDKQRGGSFGYHFYIDQDGTIYQGAPLDARTNHIKPSNHRQRRETARDLSNSNAIGVTLVGGAENVTPEQKAAAAKLSRSLMKTYGLDEGSVYGHGELQKDRQAEEGKPVVDILRGESELDVLSTGPYAILPADRRRILIDRARSSLKKRNDAREVELTELKESDLESIKRTGQPVADDVDLDEIKQVLTDRQWQKYQSDRRKWISVHEETENLRRMSNADLDDQIQKLKPEPGSDDFAFKAEVYDEVKARADEIRELREENPAMAVSHFDPVNEAIQNFDISDSRSTERVVTARLSAQEKLGIPEHVRQPITREEARILMEPVEGLEGRELLQGMEKLSRDVQRIYGRYSRHVMTSAVQLMVERKSAARQLTGLIESYVRRGKLPKGSMRETRRQLEEAAIDRAVALGEPQTVNRAAKQDRAGLEYRVNAAAKSGRQQISEQTLKQVADTRVPLAAKQYLRNNPHEAMAFDQHYQTPGLAEYVLKQNSTR